MDDRLQKFVRLAEIGSFTKAAKELHISQPALSIAIDKLETELGAELLIRGSRQLQLTEAGQAALAAAIEHQNIADGLSAKLQRLARKKPAVAVGMTDSVAARLCSSRAFDTLDNSVRVTVVVNNSRFLRTAVEQRQLDVAFVVDDGLENPMLIKQPLADERLVLVCHPELKQAVHEAVKQGKLPTFISYDRPSTTYRHIHSALQICNIRASVSLYSTSPDVMLQMVLRGRGAAALPHHTVEPLLKTGRLMQIILPANLTRPICAIQFKNRLLIPELQEFLAAVKLV